MEYRLAGGPADGQFGEAEEHTKVILVPCTAVYLRGEDDDTFVFDRFEPPTTPDTDS